MGPWMIPLIGAAGGALFDKKKPLRGALLGAGLGAAGGAAMGGAGLGFAPTEQAAMLAGQEAGLGLTGGLGWKGATTGAQGLLNSMGGAKGLLNTAGTAMNAAGQVKQMMPQDQPLQASPLSPNVPNPALANLYNGMQEQQNQIRAAEMERRMRRRGMGGRNGLA